MDKELHELEEELKRLRPVAASPDLVARIEQELKSAPLASGPAPRAALHWLWTMALPAAAAVAIAVIPFALKRGAAARDASVAAPADSPVAVAANVASATSPGASEASVLKPIAAENVLVASRDEGLVTLDDGTPARRERRQYVDTITWQNPRTHASLTWRVPREEVRVVPVLFQ